jgi:hypothetical protein
MECLSLMVGLSTKIYIRFIMLEITMDHYIQNDKSCKISRIKIKILEKINMWDLCAFKFLSDITDKIYLYVDDRTIDDTIVQKNLNNIFKLMELFEIKKPDMVIRYTSYYKIAWIYLHRLIKLKEVVLDYNLSQRYNDHQVMMKTKKIKIFLLSKNNNKYDYILYDDGWFRDVFIEAIIDDAEKIDYVMASSHSLTNSDSNSNKTINPPTDKNIESIQMKQSSGDNLQSINQELHDKIVHVLKFNKPLNILSIDLIDHFE